MRSTWPSSVALLCLFLFAMICPPVPATAAQSGSILISPVTDDGPPSEVSIQLPLRHEAKATKDSALKTLNLFQS